MSNSVNPLQRLQEIKEQKEKLAIEQALNIRRAFESQDADTIFKAQSYFQQNLQDQNIFARQPNSGVKSIVFDPFDNATSMGYYSKRAKISFPSLRNMSYATIPRAAINTRKDQFAEYCQLQPDKYSKGYIIRRKGQQEGTDATDKDKRIIEGLVKFIENCGDQENEWKWDDFETFGRKFLEDSLVLDQGTFEIVPRRNFEPYSWLAVDGATMAIADSFDDTTNVDESKKVRGSFPSYCQIYQGQIIREYYPWELCFATRNPSTNIYSNGYGRAELEDLITTVTSLLNADNYNGKFFRHGSAPKGALLVKKGNLDPNRVSELRRDWNAMMSGVNNMHKTPILDADKVEWLDMQKNNRDMEFSKFQEYLIKLICALFKISPEEIGFPLEGSNRSSMGGDSGKEEKNYSIEKGLKPLLRFFQKLINKYIIGPKTDGQFEFVFAGIEAESVEAEEERLLKAAAVYLTPDEIRKGKKMEPLPNGMGKMPLSPIMSQMVMMQQQQNQEQEQQEKESQDEEYQNNNPFLNSDEDSPFEKSFNEFIVDNLIVKE